MILSNKLNCRYLCNINLLTSKVTILRFLLRLIVYFVFISKLNLVNTSYYYRRLYGNVGAWNFV